MSSQERAEELLARLHRINEQGFWAYHPMRDEYQLLAPEVTSFREGWRSGAIVV